MVSRKFNEVEFWERWSIRAHDHNCSMLRISKASPVQPLQVLDWIHNLKKEAHLIKRRNPGQALESRHALALAGSCQVVTKRVRLWVRLGARRSDKPGKPETQRWSFQMKGRHMLRSQFPKMVETIVSLADLPKFLWNDFLTSFEPIALIRTQRKDHRSG